MAIRTYWEHGLDKIMVFHKNMLGFKYKTVFNLNSQKYGKVVIATDGYFTPTLLEKICSRESIYDIESNKFKILIDENADMDKISKGINRFRFQEDGTEEGAFIVIF